MAFYQYWKERFNRMSFSHNQQHFTGKKKKMGAKKKKKPKVKRIHKNKYERR